MGNQLMKRLFGWINPPTVRINSPTVMEKSKVVLGWEALTAYELHPTASLDNPLTTDEESFQLAQSIVCSICEKKPMPEQGYSLPVFHFHKTQQDETLIVCKACAERLSTEARANSR